jgi:hypothetical protein
MNSNLAEVGKPTRWPPGQSGNPAGNRQRMLMVMMRIGRHSDSLFSRLYPRNGL